MQNKCNKNANNMQIKCKQNAKSMQTQCRTNANKMEQTKYNIVLFLHLFGIMQEKCKNMTCIFAFSFFSISVLFLHFEFFYLSVLCPRFGHYNTTVPIP